MIHVIETDSTSGFGLVNYQKHKFASFERMNSKAGLLSPGGVRFHPVLASAYVTVYLILVLYLFRCILNGTRDTSEGLPMLFVFYAVDIS